ncbi:EAL domain-containing protein [Heliorestis acidaminivorans]|uniref:Stage 0 sporulation protein A homolog n=1 Tax=Heliorestis acidaminivorans TaxID=553427 RepID=A0A6I0EZP0_9FIRM|nr:EAL domain-containing response regulator [Heliorestis acidaminivorans]KAB2952115.1 EAL domain-containing protein [Heliorestis acidaminivorans]
MFKELQEKGRKLTILLVEDDENIRIQMERILKRFFHQVFLAQDGEEGLEIFRSKSKEIDIVITDIAMPNMNGLDMVQAMEEYRLNQPVIVISAHNDSDNLLKAISVGVDHFIIKPVNVDKLTKVLHKVILQREKEIKIKKLERLSVDNLTGLPNRFALLQDIEEKSLLALLLLNTDSFKEINNVYGFCNGDKLIKEIANRIEELIKETPFKCYHLQGDEFALLIEKGSNLETDLELYDYCLAQAKSIIKELETVPFEIEDYEIFRNFSIGFAWNDKVNNDESNNKDLLRQADVALYQARTDNKKYAIYDQSHGLANEFKNNIEWMKKIKYAIKEQGITIFYQPIIDNKTGQIAKYECLVRLRDQEGIIHLPNTFLPIAKKTKTYLPLMKEVIRKAFQCFENCQYDFSINLSIEDILNQDMRDFIIKHLDDNIDTAGRLIFEILESEGIDNYEQVIDFITEVKKRGCRISVDDFGSGYSNFYHVLQLDVDYLKLDGKLIKNIHQDRNAKVVVEAIVNFAKKLDIKTVAEFVHCTEVQDWVCQLDVNYSQGFHVGKPESDVHSTSSDIKLPKASS